MTQPIRAAADAVSCSPFLGQRVHELAGLDLEPGAHAPRFDDDVWDLGGLTGAPVQLWAATLVFDFTTIRHQPWRWVARELMIGLLAPGHDWIVVLPLAYRDALAPHTCRGRLLVLTGWLNWLTEQGVTGLGHVTQHHCDGYLHHHRGRGLRDSSLLAFVLAVKDLARYGPLFTVDRYTPGFVPWPGRTPTAVAGYQRAGENVTPPVPDRVLQPALRAGLYLVEVIGPHLATVAAALREQRRQARWKRRPRREEMLAYFNQHEQTGQPLPEIDAHRARGRVVSGWNPQDPLLRVSFGPMAHQLRCAPPSLRQLDGIRDVAEDVVRRVGVVPPLARDAEPVTSADGSGSLAWTKPLTAMQLDDLVTVGLDACLLVTAAISGMRSGELMELTPGSCLPPRQIGDGLFRFALGSKRFKGAAFAGVRDEWVVIEPAYRAVELAARLNPVPADQPVYGRFSFVTKFNTLRRWVNSPTGARLGLAPIPDGRVTARMLRRTLALDLAHRPNGLFAAKLALKHISVATSEGYAARPGGDTVADLHDDLDNGGGLSGPAARRAITTATQGPQFAGTVLNATTAKRLLANEDMLIYDNPDAFVLCHYKRRQALCHREGTSDTPSLSHCVPGCGNIVRTDRHAEQLRERADLLDKHAALAPQPIGDRLRSNATRLRNLAATHDRTRVTLKDPE
jgi:hypothetical protein